jgi:hypothetical protein
MPVKPAKSATMEPAAMEPATMEPATMEPATVKPATAVETSAATMRPSIGEIWLAERDNTQQSSRSDS